MNKVNQNKLTHHWIIAKDSYKKAIELLLKEVRSKEK